MNPFFAAAGKLLAPLLRPLAGAAAIALVFALIFARAEVRHYRKVAENEAALRVKDRAEMVEATRQATFDALMNVYRVNAQRAKIDERTIHALSADRSRADAGLDRLRQQARTHFSTPGQADLSGEREATCRAVANTGCDAIPALLKAAQDNTDQLVRLIEWARQQADVQTVPENPVPAG